MPDSGTGEPSCTTTPAAMSSPRSGFAAAVGPDGLVYVLGGWSSASVPLASVDVYDPHANAWASIAPMSTGRENLGAAAGADGTIYAVGGFDSSYRELDSLEAFPPDGGGWVALPPMPTPRDGLDAVVSPIDGRLYALGGGSMGSSPLTTVEVYDPGTQSWSTLAPMLQPRDGFAAAVDSQGRIYAAGGQSPESLEVYDPSTGAWTLETPPSPMGSLTFPSGVIGTDGLFYVIGGYTGEFVLAAVSRFSLVSESWSSAPSLNTARTGSAAVRTSGGCLYVMGGNGLGGLALQSVEVLAPGSDSWSE
jgi:N-acetylneuraminic acid mutarotase